jgi:hypothetical protein
MPKFSGDRPGAVSTAVKCKLFGGNDGVPMVMKNMGHANNKLWMTVSWDREGGQTVRT